MPLEIPTINIPPDPGPAEKKKIRKPRQMKPLARKITRKKQPEIVSPGNKKSVKTPAIVHQRKQEKAELEKKVEEVRKAKEKLKLRSDRLIAELISVKEKENELELERDKLQQLWALTRHELDHERLSKHQLEIQIHKMKTKQAFSITDLQLRLRSLILNAKTNRNVGTQTEMIYAGGLLEDKESQTVEDMTREKASIALRQNDKSLLELIETFEREKLNAQSDLKYELVQLEQRMKEENEQQMRMLREEKQRQLEEISSLHAEQIKDIEDEKIFETDALREEIRNIQNQLEIIEEERDELRVQIHVATGEKETALFKMERAEEENERMRKQLKTVSVQTREYTRDTRLMGSMKGDVEKYKQLNEILLHEHAEMERERNELREAFEKNLHLIGNVNTVRNSKLRRRMNELHRQLDS